MRPFPVVVPSRGVTAVVLVARAALVPGCLTETADVCYGPEGEVPLTLHTLNETGQAIDTKPTQWAVAVQCSAVRAQMDTFRYVYETPDGLEVVLEDDRPIEPTLTWYAAVPADGSDTTHVTTTDPRAGPAYRIRLHQEDGYRDTEVDYGDRFVLTYEDGTGGRSYGDDLPYGLYRLRVEDGETGEFFTQAQWRFFPPLADA